MFIVDTDPQFTHPVKIKVPVDGGYLDQQFRARFRLIPVEEADTFDLADRVSTTAFLKRIVIELFDLVGADNQPLSYSDKLRDKLLSNPIVRIALRDAYYGAVSGATLGN